jgi:peptidoglycan DL-endopeptidase LytE
MKYFRLILVLFFFVNSSFFAQENYTKHIIAKGENITRIAKKYKVKPEDIYKLNPEAHKVLKLNSVLLIPTLETETPKSIPQVVARSSEIMHKVLAKETGYGISKQYGITIDDLNKANPALETEGLQIGQKIRIPIISEACKNIPISSSPTEVVQLSNEVIVREVLPKETKYSIARQYGITIQELERQNPEIAYGLPVGYKLNIYKNGLMPQTVTPINSDKILTSSNESGITSNDSISVAKPISNSNLLDQLVINASDNIGSRYRTGGMSKSGFDCSGLMVVAFKSLDIKLPRTSRDQSNFGTKIEATNAQKGDLVFFCTNGRRGINHVGMIVDVIGDEIKFIHASVHRGVIISSTKESYYAKDFRQINRVIE